MEVTRFTKLGMAKGLGAFVAGVGTGIALGQFAEVGLRARAMLQSVFPERFAGADEALKQYLLKKGAA